MFVDSLSRGTQIHTNNIYIKLYQDFNVLRYVNNIKDEQTDL